MDEGMVNPSNELWVSFDENDPDFSDQTLAEVSLTEAEAAGWTEDELGELGITVCSEPGCDSLCRMDGEADGFSRCPFCEVDAAEALEPDGDCRPSPEEEPLSGYTQRLLEGE